MTPRRAARPPGPRRGALAPRSRALAAALAAAVAGCPVAGAPGGACALDVECEAPAVCARDGQCASAGSVREVVTRWTIDGQPASPATCAGYGPLAIGYRGRDPDDVVGFAPVPCALGQFTIDKLPARLDQVELGPEGGAVVRGTIPAGGVVQLDLP